MAGLAQLLDAEPELAGVSGTVDGPGRETETVEAGGFEATGVAGTEPAKRNGQELELDNVLHGSREARIGEPRQ